MLNNIERNDMVSSLSYSAHAAEWDSCLYFAKFSVYKRSEII